MSLMSGTKQVEIWSDSSVLMSTTFQPVPPGKVLIDSRLGAVATRASVASREDSNPQAILKFHGPASLDYRTYHGLDLGYLHKVYVP